ncbi:MAG TPA: ABC transporter ATP-binding protein [Actinomycetota bacterium]|nr:ABC transporter ATP-binding protein [Actinomycetota bacterium]
MSVIEVRGLKKVYRRLRGGSTVAVDGLDLVVEPGGVYGFLGPNGSGKTTTIRCLLGLARPTEGTCKIFGEDSWTSLHRVISKVGSIVEAPTAFPNFSGRRNLELLAGIYGLPRTDVDKALETVGLRDRAKDLAKTYSLGMKQRLAIAGALLKDPELLILDEPANGLDPAGIREVRDLIRRLGAEGRTVFVSSHLLSEVQQFCDEVAILSRGRSVAAGPVKEVLSHGRGAAMLLRIADEDQAIAILTAAGIAAVRHDSYLRVEIAPTEGARVSETLAGAGLYPIELKADEVDLETVFMELTETLQEASS